MKLDVWINGNMDIMQFTLFFFSDQNSGCYGYGNSQNMPLTDDNSRIIRTRLMKASMWIDGNMDIMHLTVSPPVKILVAMVTSTIIRKHSSPYEDSLEDKIPNFI